MTKFKSAGTVRRLVAAGAIVATAGLLSACESSGTGVAANAPSSGVTSAAPSSALPSAVMPSAVAPSDVSPSAVSPSTTPPTAPAPTATKTSSTTGFTNAKAQWKKGATAISAIQGKYWKSAETYLINGMVTDPSTTGYLAAINELKNLITLPDANQSAAQNAKYHADIDGLNKFFSTPGLYS